MNELRIISDHISVDSLYVERKNGIIVNNYKKLYSFLNCFFNNNAGNVFLGNKKIDNKNTLIINLLDYESISEQLKLKKGTILYEYIMEEINQKVHNSNIQENIELELYNMIVEELNDQTIDYSINLNIDISKIISSFLSIKIDLSIESYVYVIKTLIYNLKEKNIKKSIILFVNSNIFSNELDDIEGVILLKFYDSNNNILIADKVVNIDKQIIANYIRLNWPTSIYDDEINYYIDNFLMKCNNKVISISKCEELIAYNIICNILSIKIKFKIEFDINNLSNIYKDYIETLNFY